MRTAVLLLAVLTACSTPAPASNDGGLQVLATVFPLAWVAQDIAPDATVTSLAAAGQDPHDMELSPQQRRLLESADVVVYLGDIGFQPQIETAVATAAALTVPAADVVGEDALLPLEPRDDDHGDDDAGDDDHGDVDPHLWFDARLMATVATAIGEAYAEADTANAANYRDNAAAVADQLEAVAHDIDELLGDCRHDEIIVSHEAYGYLVSGYGITQHGISGAGGHSEASPNDIAELSTEVREQGLPAVLSEPVEGRTDAEAVAREAGVPIIDIYSLDIVDDATAQRGFPTLLREQAAAVAQAAQCQ